MEQRKQWAKIVAKAWADEDYKKRLLADPASMLKAEGVALPAGVEVSCVESSATHWWLVLPPKPEDADDISAAEERLAALEFMPVGPCY